jgi:hypothetical protein
MQKAEQIYTRNRNCRPALGGYVLYVPTLPYPNPPAATTVNQVAVESFLDLRVTSPPLAYSYSLYSIDSGSGSGSELTQMARV